MESLDTEFLRVTIRILVLDPDAESRIGALLEIAKEQVWGSADTPPLVH